ncbi:MAG: tyrosine-type recombinase/integrase [Rhizomicrobium sp.]
MPDIVSKRLGKSNQKARSEKSTPYQRRMERSLYDERGRRKYLVPLESKAFLEAALFVRGPTASLCGVLVLTGARISEVLALTPERIDDATGTITFMTLKRRKRVVNRAIPVPRKLLNYLDAVHHYREAQRDPERACERLWTWSRTTAWRRVKAVMLAASIPRHISSSRAVRHAFGAKAVLKDVNLTMIQRWLGHARIETTVIYTTVIGPEERALARRMRVAGW